VSYLTGKAVEEVRSGGVHGQEDVRGRHSTRNEANGYVRFGLDPSVWEIPLAVFLNQEANMCANNLLQSRSLDSQIANPMVTHATVVISKFSFETKARRRPQLGELTLG
jgi:hypothetical protein